MFPAQGAGSRGGSRHHDSCVGSPETYTPFPDLLPPPLPPSHIPPVPLEEGRGRVYVRSPECGLPGAALMTERREGGITPALGIAGLGSRLLRAPGARTACEENDYLLGWSHGQSPPLARGSWLSCARPARSRPCHCGPSSQDQAQPNAIASRCPHCTEQTGRSAVPEVLASRRSNGNIILALPSHRLGGVSCAATGNWDRPPWGTSQKPAGGEAQKCRLQGQAGMVTRTPKGS